MLFDPLAVPDGLRERATAVVLTAPYHERDARRLAVSGAHLPPVERPGRTGLEKFGIDLNRVRGIGESGPNLAAGGVKGRRDTFMALEAWPFGIKAWDAGPGGQ